MSSKFVLKARPGLLIKQSSKLKGTQWSVNQIEKLNLLLDKPLPLVPHLQLGVWRYTLENDESEYPYLLLCDTTNKKVAQGIYVPQDISHAFDHGRFYGFPECCLDACYGDHSHAKGHPAIGTGFIPCTECVKRPWEEVVAQIGERRVSTTSFPNGGQCTPAECLEFLYAGTSGKLLPPTRSQHV